MAPTISTGLIIAGIIAAILIIIAVIIFAVISNNQDDDSDKIALKTASWMSGISVALIVVSFILGSIFISRKMTGKEGGNIQWAFIISTVLVAVLISISVIVGFTTASRNEGSDQSSLYAGTSLLIVGVVIYIIIFAAAILYVQQKSSDATKKSNLRMRRIRPVMKTKST